MTKVRTRFSATVEIPVEWRVGNHVEVIPVLLSGRIDAVGTLHGYYYNSGSYYDPPEEGYNSLSWDEFDFDPTDFFADGDAIDNPHIPDSIADRLEQLALVKLAKDYYVEDLDYDVDECTEWDIEEDEYDPDYYRD